MVLEPGEQGAGPWPQRWVVRSRPARQRRSGGPEAPEGSVLPKLAPRTPVSQPKA